MIFCLVIFNRDEKIGDATYPKINLGVVSTFAENPRPADSLFHASKYLHAEKLLYVRI